MDFTHIINQLEDASLFDLYRLNAAIKSELEDPKRIRDIKKSLHIGQEIAWFNPSTNNLEQAILRKVNKTRCEVENLSDGEFWVIPYAAINLEHTDVDIESHQKVGIKKSALKVGDIVSFLDKRNNIQYAKVLKLNPKTAGVITMEKQEWRVSYSALRKSLDIEGDILMKDIENNQQWFIE